MSSTRKVSCGATSRYLVRASAWSRSGGMTRARPGSLPGSMPSDVMGPPTTGVADQETAGGSVLPAVIRPPLGEVPALHFPQRPFLLDVVVLLRHRDHQ